MGKYRLETPVELTCGAPQHLFKILIQTSIILYLLGILSTFRGLDFLLVSGPFGIIVSDYISWPTPCYIHTRTPSPVRARFLGVVQNSRWFLRSPYPPIKQYYFG